MVNIANVLALDRLGQEVSLKEKLAKSGKVLMQKKRSTVGLVSAFPDLGTTVRLSYMCVACVQYSMRTVQVPVCACLSACM